MWLHALVEGEIGQSKEGDREAGDEISDEQGKSLKGDWFRLMYYSFVLIYIVMVRRV